MKKCCFIMTYVLQPTGKVLELLVMNFFEVQEILVDRLYSLENLWMSPLEETRRASNNLAGSVLNLILPTRMFDSSWYLVPELR